MATATADFPQAERTAAALERLNSAEGYEDFLTAYEELRPLGLRLSGRFYVGRRSIPVESIMLIRGASSEQEISGIIQAINAYESRVWAP